MCNLSNIRPLCPWRKSTVAKPGMPCKTKPSFIVELPLRTPPADELARAVILDAARNVYNAALGEGLRRLDLMRQSKAYQAARNMPKGEKASPERKACNAEFRRIHDVFGFGGSALQVFAQSCGDNCWIGYRLPSRCGRTASLRAFNTNRRRPRFKRTSEYSSFEDNEAKSTIIETKDVVAPVARASESGAIWSSRYGT